MASVIALVNDSVNNGVFHLSAVTEIDISHENDFLNGGSGIYPLNDRGHFFPLTDCDFCYGVDWTLEWRFSK